ncbi:hypothetical protein ISN44_As13g026350 [Arabidopsis suecica]|uniref:Uncharacterized protein n=1 Tax=Arabidopsis suecica TaxID=45249 RepID=A0A8T1XXN1_ARASU|nr:hypothetical protein ISN44_As13g026320 [Arabidopsis suecica]KAG7538925.1 hypothetical protein ISN44_As13g026350 [Arabidopsis suecica]
MEEEHQDLLHKPIYGALRNLKITQSRNKPTARFYLLLRYKGKPEEENPGISGTNEEDFVSMRRMWKRVSYMLLMIHETPKSSYDLGCLRNKKPRKGGEFEYGVFSDEQRFMEERFSSYGTSKEPASFLRDDNRLDQQKRRKAGEFESGFLSNEQRMLKEEITTPVTFKGPASFLGYKCVLDQQKLRNGGEFGSLSNEQKLMEGTWKEPASFLGTKIELEQRKLRKAGDLENWVLQN